ncbi:hypothetical protein BS47DRAFT_1356336, partial [Hydnum rufescens UP504]
FVLVTFHFSFISFDSELPTLVPVLFLAPPLSCLHLLVNHPPLDDHSPRSIAVLYKDFRYTPTTVSSVVQLTPRA